MQCLIGPVILYYSATEPLTEFLIVANHSEYRYVCPVKQSTGCRLTAEIIPDNLIWIMPT